MPAGRFIVLEGPDGSGTTSQSKLLAAALHAEGNDVLLTAEPTDSSIGRYIREQLAQKTLPSPSALQLLFCADRALHVDQVILPALHAGTTVICDRYISSTIVYGQASGLDAAWLTAINAQFPEPDVLVYLLPPFEVCMQRIGLRSSKDFFESQAFQQRVYDAYGTLSKQACVIDSSGTLQETAAKILETIKS